MKINAFINNCKGAVSGLSCNGSTYFATAPNFALWVRSAPDGDISALCVEFHRDRNYWPVDIFQFIQSSVHNCPDIAHLIEEMGDLVDQITPFNQVSAELYTITITGISNAIVVRVDIQ